MTAAACSSWDAPSGSLEGDTCGGGVVGVAGGRDGGGVGGAASGLVVDVVGAEAGGPGEVVEGTLVDEDDVVDDTSASGSLGGGGSCRGSAPATSSVAGMPTTTASDTIRLRATMLTHRPPVGRARSVLLIALPVLSVADPAHDDTAVSAGIAKPTRRSDYGDHHRQRTMCDAMTGQQALDAMVPTGNAYDKYATSNPIERRLMSGFFRSLDRSLPDVAPARVLEVGMGEAKIAARVRERYPRASIVGIDLPDPELAAAWGEHAIPGAFADIARLPFPSRSFDLVLAIEVLEHVPHPGDALRELARVGRGSFVVSVPREPIWRIANLARGKYVGDLGNTPGHIQHWSQRSFRRLVGSHLEVVSARAPLPWTMLSARVPTGTVR